MVDKQNIVFNLKRAKARVTGGVQQILSSGDDYKARTEHQIRQFQDPSVLKKMPEISRYWMRTHINPKVRQVFDHPSSLKIYVETFAKSLSEQNDTNRILSVGAGDCQLEVMIVKALRDKGIDNFRMICTDLSQIRLDRGQQNADEAGMSPWMEFHEVDVNTMDVSDKCAGVMAHHTLHHIVELEQLFDVLHQMLHEKGAFVSIDMIGRNGHMRWPETLELVNRLWGFIPDHYKFQHQFQKHHAEFVNWDCAHKGFEGIRAQDILQLLIEQFDFDSFFGYGNLPDVFIERGYGHNLDAENPQDRAFVDFLEYLNELLIDVGHIKPTIMFAVLRKKGTVTSKTKVYKHWTPEFCVRDPQAAPHI